MEAQPFVIERTIDAPVERVWKAITDNNDIAQWYFKLADFKPEVGFEFEFEGGSDKQKYLHKCRVIEVEPERKLAHTWTYDGYDGHSTVTWELTPYGDATRLKLTHTGLETFPPLADFARESFAKGWTYIVGKSLPEYLEKAS